MYPGWDVAYTNDGLERLGQAKRGTWGGSSITSPLHDEQWTLSQTGNWEVYKLDLNGDTDFVDTDELNDDQTFNDVNELTARVTDDNGTDNYTLTYDAAGNMTDDGKDYEWVYDAFGRLVEVQNQSQQTVAEYSYNGLGYRTGWHHDVDGDGTVEANTVSNTEDPWFQFVYDTGWMVTATYRASHYSTWTIDANPREQFVNHATGLVGIAGSGGSSYIDSVILRDRDAYTNWEAQADGTLEERTYTCQNWRADVVALMTSAGVLVNQVRYDPYGKPFGIAKTDLDADGDVDSVDYLKWLAHYNSGSGTHPYADWNWDGSTDSTDSTDNTAYAADRSADTDIGRGALGYAYSHANGASRKGYAGYEIDPVLTGSEGWESVCHVRHRVLLSQLGRWARRDPLQYVGGPHLYSYISKGLSTHTDPSGLRTSQRQGSCPDEGPCVPDCSQSTENYAPVLQNPDDCLACRHDDHVFTRFRTATYSQGGDVSYDWWVTGSAFIKARALNTSMELYGTGIIDGLSTNSDPVTKDIHATYNSRLMCTDFGNGWIGLPDSTYHLRWESYELLTLEYRAELHWERHAPPDWGHYITVDAEAAFTVHIYRSPLRLLDGWIEGIGHLIEFGGELHGYGSLTIAELDCSATWCCERCTIQ